MVLLCAGKWIFRCLRKFQEKSQKIHAPEGPLCQKWCQRGPEAPQASCWRGPTPGRSGRPPGGAPTSSGALPRLLFIPVARKPQNRSRFSNSRRGAAATLCSSPGGLIWRLFCPPVRGDHLHRHHHHQSILPP